MRRLTLLASLVLLVGTATALAGPPATSPEVTVAEGVTKHGVHWKVTGYTYGPYNDVWLTVRERSASGGSTSEGASPKPECGKVGIAGVSGFANPPLTTVDGQVSARVGSVKVILQGPRRARKARPRIKFISPEDAATLGTERFGWWYVSFAKAAFDPSLRVVAYDRAGKKLRPAATFDDGEFGCSNRKR